MLYGSGQIIMKKKTKNANIYIFILIIAPPGGATFKKNPQITPKKKLKGVKVILKWNEK